ncbi:hypothetical protein BCR32DRAFT_286988 [Anaeromyces robustus]|uniref:Uncharacterized protein n=1 Tax=Anaeromyces robustus TaxID=1754192 RepID=A0A1Y1VTK8_9FUNG|nr:hypothetical protein BCR32DRAFT_286988 [Anaeromyces robustus]|eukprot:ORX64618.1 hypothetical protein BCR32DRAFT_286988 [Anaeromyces robustus]
MVIVELGDYDLLGKNTSPTDTLTVKLQIEERLTKDNFEKWEFLINHILKSKGKLQYVNIDISSKFKKRLQEERNKFLKDSETLKLIEDLETKLEDAEKI